MPPKKHMFGAVFDVSPVDKAGRLDVGKINTVKEELDLRPKVSARRVTPVFSGDEGGEGGDHDGQGVVMVKRVASRQAPTAVRTSAPIPRPKPQLSVREALLEELEVMLANADAEPMLDDEISVNQSEGILFGSRSPARARLAVAETGESIQPQSSFADRAVARARVRGVSGAHMPSRELEEVLAHGRNQLVQSLPAETRSPRPLAPTLASSPMKPIQARPIARVASAPVAVATPPRVEGRLVSSVVEPVVASQTMQRQATPVWSPVPASMQRRSSRSLPRFAFGSWLKRWLPSLLMFMIVVGFVTWLSYTRSVEVKNNVAQNGTNAFANIEGAKSDLQSFHFADAADHFALAYDDLHKASGTLSTIGASFLSVFSNVPILNRLSAANNLTLAGENLSQAGENLALAFNTLSTTNFFSYIDFNQPLAKQKSLTKLAKEFKDVLAFANTHIQKATTLLADIDISAMPADKQDLFAKLKDKTPEFNTLIGNAIEYTDFLIALIGDKGTHTYMLLFQNNGELRATGGFPGSYGLVTFQDGAFEKLFIDDIYNPDGQLKENIIPPVPLQHITPTWGMRDVNWFADFPTSARKIEEYYKKDGGPSVDGVVTMTPDMIVGLLKIVGPIDMPDYKRTISADNFLSEVQAEIEYGSNRAQPKTILKAFEPLLLAKIKDLDKSHWADVAHLFMQGVQEKQVLAYFNDPQLESFARDYKLSGELAQTPGDYLQVVYTNVKGSKADVYTQSSLDLTTQINDQSIHHDLKITRTHQGGDLSEGFYNRPNPAYVRVYVPKGATLTRIDGQTMTTFKPLVDYSGSGFTHDSDLAKLEATIQNPFPGVDVFEESGKTVFGFWLVVDPQKTQSVSLAYDVSAPASGDAGSYDLLIQKQSGTEHDALNQSLILPNGKKLATIPPETILVGNQLVWHTDLSIDRELKLEW